jgi:hypothetical protein
MREGVEYMRLDVTVGFMENANSRVLRDIVSEDCPVLLSSRLIKSQLPFNNAVSRTCLA